LDGCAVSGASYIETPLGNLAVCHELRQELLATKHFSIMDQESDQQEHSGEMHYPYIVKAIQDAGVLLESIRVLPVMVGGIHEEKEKNFGRLLAPVIARMDVSTIVSTDFCHWGRRFRYQPTAADIPIFEHITNLDRRGMSHIELQEPGAFAKYIRETQNTVCGRHPVAVWMHAIRHNKDMGVEELEVKFVRYAQSSKVTSMYDSSVSYASAVARKV
jgi:AmmeMemoRadiSam system protein B